MKPFISALALAVTFAGAVSPALAQPSIRLNRFTPSELTQDGFHISSAETPGHLSVGASLYLDYNNDPVVVEAAGGTSGSVRRFTLVEHQVTAHLGFQLGLGDRVAVYAGLPVYVVESGEDIPASLQGTFVDSEDPATPGNSRLFPVHAADGFTVGDPWVGGRLRLYGGRDTLFAIAVQGRITLPLAQFADSSQHHAGEETVSGHPEAIVQLNVGRLRLMANMGAHVRSQVRECETTVPQSSGPDADCFTGVSIGTELTYGIGATVALLEDQDLWAVAEIVGRTGASSPLTREQTPVEVLLGLKYLHSSGLAAGLGGGFGISRGYGAPDFRVLGTIGFATEGEAPEEPIGDSDGDGIPDDTDRCPNEPEDVDEFEDQDGCVDPDNDGDGVLDGMDGCPNEAEDGDGFEDENGCPDPDNDGDGIADGDDACPNDAEDADEFEDENGCPDPDNDGDGVIDGEDRCATEAGPSENGGCPWPDTDGDGIADPMDSCVNEPGTAEFAGCPEAPQVIIRADRIEITDRIYFATNRDVIQNRSFALLDRVAQVINDHPQIAHIDIEGHTDSRGRADRNMDLSQRRANAVMRYLVEHGVAAERLTAHGYGSTRPVVENARTRAQHAQNRRVEFNVRHDDADDGGAHGESAPEADSTEAAPEPSPDAE